MMDEAADVEKLLPPRHLLLTTERNISIEEEEDAIMVRYGPCAPILPGLVAESFLHSTALICLAKRRGGGRVGGDGGQRSDYLIR